MRVRFLSLALLAVGVALASGSASAQSTILRCGTLIDGVSERVRTDQGVRVEGERITEVAPFSGLDLGDASVVNLRDQTCLPGLIDAHAHILIETDDYQVDHLRRSSGYKALRGLNVARQMLDAGWTTIRIVGDADVSYAHFDVRTAIEEGLFVGPRIHGAGHYLSITGGGGDLNFLAPEHEVLGDGLVVDGVEEIRKAVREEVKYGSDWIKVLASGAMMSVGNDPTRAHFSPEELETMVDEAVRLGVPVAAHAHSAEGIKEAVRAGVRSIEHATFLDEEGIKLMVENDVFLIPTVYVGDYYLQEQAESEAQAELVDLTLRYRAMNMASLGQAIQAGVRVGVGTDHVGFPITQGVREFSILVEAGMTPMEAIKAGTLVNAQLLGRETELGSVEVGILADIIAVPGDPLVDLGVLEDVHFVMLGGEVVAGRKQ
jgi:imidazolonepropionase-like amidohydrolase